jgi:hypothetical protein
MKFYEFNSGHSSMVIEEKIDQLTGQIDFAHRHLGTIAPR